MPARTAGASGGPVSPAHGEPWPARAPSLWLMPRRIVAPVRAGGKMTLGQVEQVRIEETQQLLEAGDPQAVTRLREMLFDVRRGAYGVTGAQAVSLARSAF